MYVLTDVRMANGTQRAALDSDGEQHSGQESESESETESSSEAEEEEVCPWDAPKIKFIIYFKYYIEINS